jgi:hypothetical protein
MRNDQYLKLKALSEKIADVALFDADPDNWVGAGKAAKKLTKEQRGNAYWCRKVALGTISVLMRVEALAATAGFNQAMSDKDELSLTDEIANAEAAAANWLEKELARTGKKANA